MDCGDTDLESYKFPEILQTFYYLEMVATGVAVAVLGATLVYLIVVERLKKMIMFMEAHVRKKRIYMHVRALQNVFSSRSVCTCSSTSCSPWSRCSCRPASHSASSTISTSRCVKSRQSVYLRRGTCSMYISKTFRRFCLAFSFLICYTNLAVFGWLAMLSGYSCWMATEACQLHIYNAISTSLEENTAAEDENGNDPRTAKMARKISRNELKNRRTPRCTI